MISLPLLAVALWIQTSPAPPPSRSAAYGLYLEALSLKEAGKADEALAALQQTLKADPRAADALAEMARIHAERDRFPLSIDAVGRAIRLAPDRADLRSLAGLIHQFYAQSGGGEAELRLAAKEFEAAYAINPADPSPLRDLTRIYSVLRDEKAALDTWKRLSVADPRNGDALVQVATLSMGAGDTAGAVAALETAVAADGTDPKVLQLLGDIKQQTGKPEEALKHYEAAARLDNEDLVTRLKMGEILIESRKDAEALTVADQILKQDAENRFARDMKARALKELRRYDEALDIAESLAASAPRDLKAAFLVVTLLEQKGSLDAADEKLGALVRRNTSGEDAESIGRNNRVFWAHAGMVRQRLGKYREAADAFGEAVNAVKEKDASLVTYRIDALISAKDFATALKEVRAARLDPALKDEKDLGVLEAYALRGAGQEKEAAAMIDASVSAPTAQAEELLAAAEFYQRGKNLERAREFYTQAVAKDPKNVRGLFSLGAVLERLKRFDEAEKAFRDALALAPDSAITLNYLGYMNADRNVKPEEALTLINKAVASEPDNGSYLDSLAWVFYRLGRHEEAETAIRKAVVSQDKNAVVLAHLGLILAARGLNEEALKYLKASLAAEDEDGELDRALVEGRIRSLGSEVPKKP